LARAQETEERRCSRSLINPVWGFHCQVGITTFLLSFVIPFFCKSRAESILPFRPYIAIAVARSGGQGRLCVPKT
jgi:hypothetical protein